MKLAIVIGHDKNRKGAFAVLPINKYEYDYNLDIAEHVFRFAMELGIQTRIFLRDKVGIAGCYKEVNEWLKGSIGCCIELHFNAFNGKAQGTETLFDTDPPESLELAREIHEAVIAVFNRHGKYDRGLKLIDVESGEYQRGKVNFKECKHPMALVEPFFGDNKEDATLGQKHKIEYAAALVHAVERFMKNYVVNEARNLSLH